ncbi:hypothetical protein LXM94_03870 [Rhizobium sp. TRM95111]|nr:hypothetical protein [Rhizobium alarense]
MTTLREPLEPADILMLKGVLDETCARRGIAHDDEAAEWLAASLIRVFQQGVRNRRELLDFAVTR